MGKILQRFCATCGTLMRQKRSGIKGYDIYTGKPWHEIRLFCPQLAFVEALARDNDARH